jgi:hypothetical protein
MFAKSLLALAKISRGDLRCVTFVGDHEAALLAAIAECLLDLSIEIRDENDVVAYFNHESQRAQAIFKAGISQGAGTSPTLLIQSTTYFVSSGTDLISTVGGSMRQYETPTTWSTYFRIAFPCWGTFEMPTVSHALVNALKSFLASDPLVSSGDSHVQAMISSQRLFVTSSEQDNKFLHSYATAGLKRIGILFPELKTIINSTESTNEVVQPWAECIKLLTEACECRNCRQQSRNWMSVTVVDMDMNAPCIRRVGQVV